MQIKKLNQIKNDKIGQNDKILLETLKKDTENYKNKISENKKLIKKFEEETNQIKNENKELEKAKNELAELRKYKDLYNTIINLFKKKKTKKKMYKSNFMMWK